jgi:hypothetical protein
MRSNVLFIRGTGEKIGRETGTAMRRTALFQKQPATRIFRALLFAAATSTAALCAPGGVLENVTKIRVDPTVIEQPEKIKDPVAANLVRFDLRAAIEDAHLAEGDSPIRAHMVLDEFSPDGGAKRLMNIGTGRNTRTVDGKLVIVDANGKELASVKIHVHGSVGFSPGDGNSTQGREAASDLERRLLEEIEKLK